MTDYVSPLRGHYNSVAGVGRTCAASFASDKDLLFLRLWHQRSCSNPFIRALYTPDETVSHTILPLPSFVCVLLDNIAVVCRGGGGDALFYRLENYYKGRNIFS